MNPRAGSVFGLLTSNCFLPGKDKQSVVRMGSDAATLLAFAIGVIGRGESRVVS